MNTGRIQDRKGKKSYSFSIGSCKLLQKKYTNNKPWIWHVCQIFSLLKCKKGIQPFDHTFILYVYPWLIVIYRVNVRVQEHLLFIFLWCWHQVFKNTICGCGSYVCSVQTIPPGHHRQSCYEFFWSFFCKWKGLL